jgi:hypothetical protein
MRMLPLVVGLTIAAPALAVTVPAGIDFTLDLTGTKAATDPTLAGTVLIDKIVPFATAAGAKSAVNGTVQVRVVRNSLNHFDYYYRIKLAQDSTVPIRAFQVTGFPRVSYEADWRTDGLGSVAPSKIAGSTIGADNLVAFRFDDLLKPGTESRFFFIRSSASASDAVDAKARIKLPDGSFTPEFAVPRPSTAPTLKKKS